MRTRYWHTGNKDANKCGNHYVVCCIDMRIAIIQAGLLASGGGERQAIELAKELRRIGHDARMYAFAYNSSVCFPEDTHKPPIVSLAATQPSVYQRFFRFPFVGTFFHFLYENTQACRLAALIPDDTDILNPHDQTSCRTAYYFKKRHPLVPAVLMLNDLHTASWSLFDDPLFGRKRKNVMKMPFYRLRDFLERLVFWRSITAITVLNDRTARILKRETGRASIVVRSGVSIERFAFRARTSFTKEKEIRLLAHGLFYIHRRFEDIIEAVKILRNDGYQVRLQIIGDFTHRDIARAYYGQLVRLVRALHLEDRIVFSGTVSDAALLRAYYESDIFVSATHMQTWGLAVFEALATGLPIVISRTIGAAEVLTDGETALLIEPGNPPAIARAIRRLVDDAVLYERLSKDGAAFVRDTLSWEKYARTMLAVFERARIAETYR